MPKIKQSIECWLLSEIHGRPGVVLMRVAERAGKHPEFLQPVTGGIEAGEDSRTACLREVFEETGLTLSPSQLRSLSAPFVVEIDENLTINKTIFFAQAPNAQIRINPKEHVGFEIALQNEVSGKLYWQSNKDTWAMVRRRVERD